MGGGGGIGSVFSSIVKVATLGLVDIEGQQRQQEAAEAQARALRQQAEASEKAAKQQAEAQRQQNEIARNQLAQQAVETRSLESQQSQQEAESAAVRNSERAAQVRRRGLTGTMLTSSLGTTTPVSTTGAKLGNGSLS